jgi:hypothetical protein
MRIKRKDKHGNRGIKKERKKEEKKFCQMPKEVFVLRI